MGQILVEFNHQLKQSEIIIPLIHSSEDESGKNYKDNQPEIQQTQVHGILSPLIMINKTVIDFDSVIDFSLKSIGPLPSLSVIVFDRYNLISSLDTPGMDNEIRIQILPQFDGKYKKIDMTFFISNIKVMNGNTINLTGVYKSQSLNQTQFKSFGKINTYNLVTNIAKETQLGFATNVKSSQDERYVYCDNKTYIELMSREILRSGGDHIVYDWWIDFWNNINFVDIYERYNAIDDRKDMKIWVSGQSGEVTEGSKIIPIETEANINNHPATSNLELAVKHYSIKNKSNSSVNQGTDKLYSIYLNDKYEHMDYLIQDGDIKKDIFCRYEYLGEVYGDYDYLLAEKKCSSFLQKINSESVEVVLKQPTLGLMRGHKVNFVWYNNDSQLANKKTALSNKGLLNNVDTNIPLNETVTIDRFDNDSAGSFEIDKSISGQYLITACNMRYSNANGWEYILTINKPAISKTKLLKDE